jgi:hypothetical protein
MGPRRRATTPLRKRPGGTSNRELKARDTVLATTTSYKSTEREDRFGSVYSGTSGSVGDTPSVNVG